MSEILMPRLSDTMEEGVISAWHKREGDNVTAGEVLADIETDKAVMEYEAFESGTLQKILVPEGQTATIGAPIAVIGTGTPQPATGPTTPAKSPEPPTETRPADPTPGAGSEDLAAGARSAEPPAGAFAPAGPGTSTEPGASAGLGVPAGAGGHASRPPSSPLARRVAREKGVDLATVRGTGPGGRIVRADIEAAAARTGPPAAAAVTTAVPADSAAASAAAGVTGTAAAQTASAGSTLGATARDLADVEQVPLSRIRKVTARRLAESMRTAPHYYLTRTVDMGGLLGFRAALNESLAPTGGKVSVNDLIVKASATALRANPVLNVSFTEEHLLVHKRVHVGVAVALEEGLVVPVIRDADTKSVSQIGAETRDLAGRAREQRLTPQEMSGGTFTVSNLGMFGVDAFTAVINPPEAAILAVGATRQEPVVRDGQVVPRDVMTITLSVDHRAADGATAATFLGQLVDLLENPLRIIA